MDKKEPTFEGPKSIWQNIFPIFLCCCVFFAVVDSNIQIGIKKIPEMIVYFFFIIFVSFFVYGCCYAFDTVYFGPFVKRGNEKIGCATRWRRFLNRSRKLLVFFVAMVIIFAFASGKRIPLEETKNYQAGYEAGYSAGADDFSMENYNEAYQDGYNEAWYYLTGEKP